MPLYSPITGFCLFVCFFVVVVVFVCLFAWFFFNWICSLLSFSWTCTALWASGWLLTEGFSALEMYLLLLKRNTVARHSAELPFTSGKRTHGYFVLIWFIKCGVMSRDSLLIRAPDSWSKGCEFESRQEPGENSVLQSLLCVLTLIRCPLHPRVTAVARKRSRSFCQKCKWQVAPKHSCAPLTRQSRIGLTMPLSRQSVGTYPETSSHATWQGTFSLPQNRYGSLSHWGLILA